MFRTIRPFACLVCLSAAAATSLTAQLRLRFDSVAATVVYSPSLGLEIRTPDARHAFRIRSWMHADYKGTMDDPSNTAISSLTLRRARLILDAQIVPGLIVRLSPDFGTRTVQLEDAFADISVSRSTWLRAGRHRVPFGAERERLITEQVLPERSLGSQLTGNRDVGVTVNAEYRGGRIGYVVGVMNGVPDGGSASVDANDAKDVVVRLSVMPRLRLVRGAQQGVRLTAGMMRGVETGTATDVQLPTYSTSSGVPFFRYAAADVSGAAVIADGRRTRLGAALSVHEGRFGLLSEALRVQQRVRRDAATADVRTEAWSASAMLSLTGEPSAANGLTPARAFDASRRAWGAVQAVVRASRVTADRGAFPLFAPAATASRQATAWGAGVNWFLTRVTKVQIAYEVTTFDGGAAANADRPTDHTLWVRSQLMF